MELVNAVKLLRETLTGGQPADEKTQRSIVLLAERLEQLKHRNSRFANVGFSAEIEHLAERNASLGVS